MPTTRVPAYMLVEKRKTVDPSISTISMKHHNVVGATVGLNSEGLKS